MDAGHLVPAPEHRRPDKPGKEYYESLANSPFGNELLLEFAKKCVTAEQLGTHEDPDLLVISFSSNDLIGHTWGPDSQEVLDVTLRSDALMAELLGFLDEKVGKGQYLLAVTADHGICPLPEVSRKQGIDAKRVDPRAMQKALEEHLTAKFGAAGEPAAKGEKKPAWIEAFSALATGDTSTCRGSTSTRRWRRPSARRGPKSRRRRRSSSRSDPNVARVLTRADLEGTIPADDIVATRVKRSYRPDRCGDVCVVLKEWYLPSSVSMLGIGSGTTHGSPLRLRPPRSAVGLRARHRGRHADRTDTPQAAAAIFAKWLGVRNPKQAEFPVPETLEKK